MARHQRAQMAGQDLTRDDVGRRPAVKQRAVAEGPPPAPAAVEHHQREHRERGPRNHPSRSPAEQSAAVAPAHGPSPPPRCRASRWRARSGGGGGGGLARQRRADAPAERVRRAEAQRRVAKGGAQSRERGAFARTIDALLEMALKFERRLEAQLAVGVGVEQCSGLGAVYAHVSALTHCAESAALDRAYRICRIRRIRLARPVCRRAQEICR